ncbi:hypothetical protein OSB04_019064 [Centaurea solstitialis]|uniref:Uncharacterized protein n=1 Tax=Centaurea solstitialis TaxID=347529 RepID=A0AA38T143_9ASTR|nr:hypothetical protein OSB04_019064 [Centaurea solstitialis]
MIPRIGGDHLQQKVYCWKEEKREREACDGVSGAGSREGEEREKPSMVLVEQVGELQFNVSGAEMEDGDDEFGDLYADVEVEATSAMNVAHQFHQLSTETDKQKSEN